MRRLTPFLLVLACVGCPGPSEEAATPATPAAEQPAEQPAPPPAPTPAGYGTCRDGGGTMTAAAVVPLWNAEDSALKLVVLPFEPSDAELERIRKDETFFMISDREPSVPGFTDRTPFCELTIRWPFDPDKVGQLDKASLHVFMNYLKEKGSNTNSTRMNGEGITTLEGELKVGGQVKVALQGEIDFMGTPVAWDVNFAGEILAPLKD